MGESSPTPPSRGLGFAETGRFRDAEPSVLRDQESRWWLFMLLGVAAVVVGIILVLDLAVAVETLALLVALGLIFTGVGELVAQDRYRSGLSIAAGIGLVAAGIVAMVWPGITLWVLAVIAAVGLLVSGAVRLAGAMMFDAPGRGWLLLGGALSVVVGLMALAWPGATVLVLALLLGIRTVIYGAAEIAYALALRDIRASGGRRPGAAPA
jgi:uncharacterized membrane protein HdeD (DUF308 family)